MGRHAKPHNPKEQPLESPEDSSTDEHHPSRGRHAKDRHHRMAAGHGEQADSLSTSAG
ncbi:hypothetical protein [Nonomuraea sp. NPDC049709]|uniref:hypothetical protein n=1 Tax=unclassified Nonomuraea TaxID=2593643 RepID=UPI0034254417